MFTRLLNIGITNDLDFYQKREVRILNLLASIVFFGQLIGATNIIFLHHAYPAFFQILIAICNLMMLILTYKHYYQTAAYLFVIYINATLLYVIQYYDVSTANYLYYFPVIFCVALLHNPNKPIKRTIIFFSIVTLSFLCSRFFKLEFIKKVEFTDEQNRLLFQYNIYFCALVTIVLVYMFIRLINKQNNEVSELLQTVKKDQVTIQNSLTEKDVLLAEIQHRVKNNLAVIIGLFNLQKDTASNDETRQAITEAKNRVLSIAMVHEKLYKKEDLSHINLKSYISELTKEVVKSHPLSKQITILEELESIDSTITKAVPIGLIINEAITNALKHAFNSSSEKPTIKISMITTFDLICIKILDNGKGFENLNKRSDKSLGLTLIESLAEQIDGEVYYSNDNGAVIKFSFPVTSR
jgi:two-component sensor histidine kinase